MRTTKPWRAITDTGYGAWQPGMHATGDRPVGTADWRIRGQQFEAQLRELRRQIARCRQTGRELLRARAQATRMLMELLSRL